MNTLEERARAFATKAHEGQVRRYTNAPYITHPEAVANLVRSVPHSPEMIAAAWLHDTVEDTAVTIEDIDREFGPDVAHYVKELTSVSKPTDGNRKARKAKDLAHMQGMSPNAQTVKLADILDNTRTVATSDPSFARVYLSEKAEQLGVLHEGDETLWQMCRQSIERGMWTLKKEGL